MKSIVKTLMVIIAYTAASCAAYAESPDESVSVSKPAQSEARVASLVTVPEDAPAVFKEISGLWIGKDTGNLGEMYLRDVKVSGGYFTAKFFTQSASRSACDVNEVVQGTYINGVFEFYLRRTVCGKDWEHKGRLNTADWKGGYTSGRFSGWYVIKNVEKAS